MQSDDVGGETFDSVFIKNDGNDDRKKRLERTEDRGESRCNLQNAFLGQCKCNVMMMMMMIRQSAL